MMFTLSIVCSANTIPLEQCAGGGYQPVGQCPTYNNYSSPPVKMILKAFAYDKESELYGTGSGSTLGKAKKEALQNCGTKNCKVIASGFHAAVVASPNGIVISDNYKKLNYVQAYDILLKKCEDMGGINCKVIWSTF